jgi:hypothetical protein
LTKPISAARIRTDTPKRTPGTGGAGKEIVVGAVERKGNVVARVISHAKAATLNAFVRQAVSKKVSLIATDENAAYNPLDKIFNHNHSAGQYVDGVVHTATIDGFWSWVASTRSAANTSRCTSPNSSSSTTIGTIPTFSAQP